MPSESNPRQNNATTTTIRARATKSIFKDATSATPSCSLLVVFEVVLSMTPFLLLIHQDRADGQADHQRQHNGHCKRQPTLTIRGERVRAEGEEYQTNEDIFHVWHRVRSFSTGSAQQASRLVQTQ